MSTLTLITLSYRSGALIERCLSALVAQEAAVIHADNGSDDLDLKALATRFPAVRQIAHGDNLGFARGMNLAAATATTQWIGFINPDAFIEPGWVAAMQEAIEAHPDVSIFTALQLSAENPLVMDGAGDALTFFGFPYRAGIGHRVPHALRIAEVFAPCGAAFIIRRSLFERLGGFDENFFCYCEDADLGFRARLIGERTLFVPQARTLHVGSASSGVRSDFALWHGYRNRLWLYIKSMPSPFLWISLPIHIGLTLLGAIKDTLKGRGGLPWRALAAALSGIGPILRARKNIQATRTITALRLAKSLTWNPVRIARRETDFR
ncbi:glycosyltransferase family 2 protein [Asticcacaulis sp. EMRT-3]|uniref:glycosyltransferase family 2 protein n=1 Tax=Asticcacaulis sp. EMRT-3 TaxID=3040349 RepID=UPI0024AFDE5F|nr:glycosyltransferase family 2 protein [Asticcacaulis sp. EMRT-3]MDI7775585.1 glycosyltransferase family 2 protein [Asticcacaulis sp. EMRT-3]